MSRHENIRTATPPQRGFRVDPARPLALLAKCPVHAPTPFGRAEALARVAGVGDLWLKDEGARMGLGSFKALGGAFAVAQMICDAGGVDDPTEAPAEAAQMTFVTASAGNHGLSVAAGARVFGANAAVILPESAPAPFARRIAATGARVIHGGSYDECVAQAIRLADECGWLHLADGSWPGYHERPALVMEGYAVLAEECRAALADEGDWPDHVFLQAGVGGLAAAVAAHIRETWPQQPQIVVVEPERAPCLRNSVQAGALTAGEGPDSNMGRLDCKNASMLAYEALRHDADLFVTVTDEAAQQAADLLGRHGVAATPSGAAGLAGLLVCAPGRDSRAMIIVSEGLEDG